MDMQLLAAAQERDAEKAQKQHINDTLDRLLADVKKLTREVATLTDYVVTKKKAE